MISPLDDAHIEEVLTAGRLGHIGCQLDDRPYVVPITYVYSEGAVYGHANEGMKVQAMRKHPTVCFEVDDIKNASDWRTVVAWGAFEELEGAEATRARDLLLSRLAPDASSETFFPSRRHLADYATRGIRFPLMEGVLFRIRLTEATGRQERRAAP